MQIVFYKYLHKKLLETYNESIIKHYISVHN
jgi:hypothetical protein